IAVLFRLVRLLCAALRRLGFADARLRGSSRSGLRWRKGVSVREDFQDPNRRQILPVASFAPVILAAALFENDDLGSPALFHDLRRNRSPGNEGGTETGLSASANHQHVGEAHGIAGSALDFLNLKHVLWGNFILLAARANDRVHGVLCSF